MALAITFALMTVAALAGVMLPLLRRARPGPERGAFDRAVYRDQLQELERDVARGLIDAEAAKGARLEIARRLLAADRRDEAALETAGSPMLAVGLALAMPVIAVVAYLAVGSPGLGDEPLAARAAEQSAPQTPPDHGDFAAGAAKLEEQLKQDPEDAGKWLLLARTESELGQWQKSVDAYRHVMALTKDRAEFASGYGEMLVLAADGVVTPAAQEQFRAALAHDPRDVAARYYTALAAEQAGHPRQAIAQWQALAADVPQAEIRSELSRRLAEAAASAGIPTPALAPAKLAAADEKGPSKEDMANAAQMSETDRQAMIRSMVARLAAEMESEPSNVEGWMRLGRAYGVLGERDKALAAYRHAEALLPKGSGEQRSVAQAIAALERP